jgi:hypothetical protein
MGVNKSAGGGINPPSQERTRTMTEYQIELSVEAKMNSLDRAFMNPANKMTQADYDAEVKKLNRWANAQMARRTKG